MKRKWRIVYSFSVALIVVVSCFYFIRVGLPKVERREGKDIIISYVSHRNGAMEDLFNEQSDLLDTQSIFLPSKWSTEEDLTLSITNKSLFEDFPDGALIKGNEDVFPQGLRIIGEEQDILSIVDRHLGSDFRYFSIRESEMEKVRQRHAYLTVRDMRTGGVMLREEIGTDVNFPNYDSLWREGRFQHIVDVHMIAPEPLLLASSGIDSIDSYIRDYIRKSLRINELGRGYYEIFFEP